MSETITVNETSEDTQTDDAIQYLTCSNHIRKSTKMQYNILRTLTRAAKSLWNEIIYYENVIVPKTTGRKHAGLSKIIKYLQENSINYRILNANSAQQIARQYCAAWKSYREKLKNAKQNGADTSDIKPPSYMKKTGRRNIILQEFMYADDEHTGFLLPYSRSFAETHERQILPIPEHLRDKEIREIKIIPIHDGVTFKIEYIYRDETELSSVSEVEEQVLDLILSGESNPDKPVVNVMSIDLGIENLATCVETSGASFIIDGRPLKSHNQWYNKEIARIGSERAQSGDKRKGWSDHQYHVTEYRNDYVENYIKTAASYIVQRAIQDDVKIITMGWNADFKESVLNRMWNKTRQQFTILPLAQLRDRVEFLCQRNGILFERQDESYTSKASFLDGDWVPTYGVDDYVDGEPTFKFSGCRVKRGLYRAADGSLLNADVNGACNSLVKWVSGFAARHGVAEDIVSNSVGVGSLRRCCRGAVSSPERLILPCAYVRGQKRRPVRMLGVDLK